MIRLLLTAMLMLLAGSLPAQEAEVSKDSAEETQQTAEAEAEAEEELPDIGAGSLRGRDLGDAFENFQPSEEISVDNAVTFPVDI